MFSSAQTRFPAEGPLWLRHVVALVLFSWAVGVLFLQSPGFGDDLTYWTTAFDVHERGLKAWGKSSFHDLRWPVWGLCWVLQGVFGFGLAAYWGVPLLYLSAGAVVAFSFGSMLGRSVRIGWACALAFLFLPLLDTVAYRPMPDLSEAVWGGFVVLAWWRLMHAETTRASVLWALLTGVLIFLAEANRLTGIFIVPVIGLGTLLYFRKRLGWLILAGLVSAIFYGLECAFYKWLFDDWLHNLHAHESGKREQRHGTDATLVSADQVFQYAVAG
jgi:4-amino-4-deoxy-L-arabinose transferase-like glycosyltransferase